MSLSEFIFGLVVYIGVAAVVLIIRNRKFNKLANNNTQLFERIDFYKKKWLKEHIDGEIRDSDGNSYGRKRITVVEALSMWQEAQK